MQTLSTLIRPPTAAERKTFDALATDAITFTADELEIIRDALFSHMFELERVSERFTLAANSNRNLKTGGLEKLRTAANDLSIQSCDARALADKISKLATRGGR